MDVEILPNNRPTAASPTHTANQQQHVLLPGQSEVSNGSLPARCETDLRPFHTAAEENDENDESSEQRAATCVCVWEGWLADTLLYYVYSKRSNGAAGWLQENRWFMRKHRHFRDSTRSDTHPPGFQTQFIGHCVRLLRYTLVVLCLEHSRILKEEPGNRIRSISTERRDTEHSFFVCFLSKVSSLDINNTYFKKIVTKNE